jgi:microcystin-dependent protein
VSGPAAGVPRRRFLARALGAWAGSAWLGGWLDALSARAATQLDDTPFIGEIRLFAGPTAPQDWAFCDGQQVLIADNQPLFQLIGTSYGGDGVTTFNLPDLRGRLPLHVGPGYTLGQLAGEETVTLTVAQLPGHAHTALAGSAPGSSDDPTGRVPARNAAGVPAYAPVSNTALAPATMLATGGSGSHPNVQPWLGIHFIISLFGVYPSQT